MEERDENDAPMDEVIDAALIHFHQSASRPLGFMFFSVFLVFGSSFLYVMAILPMWKVRSSKEWIETPCKILSSYNLELQYQYRFAGTVHVGDQYDFMSFGDHNFRKNARKYPKGSQHVCFVDPDNPRVSVLNRETPSDIWLGFLFPCPFVGLGAGGLIVLMVQGRKRRLPDCDTPKR